MEKTTFIKTIKELERVSRMLEPDSEQRSAMVDTVLSYSETLLENLKDAPAFRLSGDNSLELYKYLFSEGPRPIEDVLAILNNCVDSSGVNPISGGNMGYIPGGPIYPSALGDFLAAVSNRYSGHFYGSPGAVRLENMLLRWMAGMIGYPKQAAGNLTSGGSIANLIAIVTARESYALKSRDYHRSVVYLTEQAHHSIHKGLLTAGLQDAVIHLVPTDDKYRMLVSELESAILQDERNGLHPWLVVANAGTTNSGAVDPLADVAAVADQNKVWYHIDGAYGAFFALTEIGKKVLDGMGESDSLVLDPHKGLFLPYGTGAVLVKNARALKDAFKFHAPYAQDTAHFEEELSPSDLSPELSRHFRGLRLWLPLMLVGKKPFAAALEEKLLLAQYFHQRMAELDGFIVGPKPDLSIVIFRYNPSRGDINTFNQKLIQAIQEDGRIFLSSTTIKGEFFIRMAILSIRTHLDDIDNAVEIIKSEATSIKQS